MPFPKHTLHSSIRQGLLNAGVSPPEKRENSGIKVSILSSSADTENVNMFTQMM